jgi:effector-binding domain-containing protein
MKEGRTMAYDVSVKNVPEVLVASIRTHADIAIIGKEVQAAFERLGGFVASVGFGDGMPGVVTHAMPPDGRPGDMDVEVVMPIKERAQAPEGIQIRVLEGGVVAFTIHGGPDDQVGLAYRALAEWIPSNGFRFAGPPREFYLNDPNEVGEEEALTEIQFPIR